MLTKKFHELKAFHKLWCVPAEKNTLKSWNTLP